MEKESTIIYMNSRRALGIVRDQTVARGEDIVILSLMIIASRTVTTDGLGYLNAPN